MQGQEFRMVEFRLLSKASEIESNSFGEDVHGPLTK